MIARTISQLEQNCKVIEALLSEIPESQISWKPNSGQWSLLEVICHLYDEEREDFRTRTFHVLDHPGSAPPSIDPEGWVNERKYSAQNFQEKLTGFLTERKMSVQRFQALENPSWDNVWHPPNVAPRTAQFFLENWLAHDYLHIRQINRLKYEFHAEQSKNDLSYAGNW